MAILARTREHYTVTRGGVLGGGVGLVMTHTAPTVAAMSVSHRRGRGKPSLGGGHSHGDTSHLKKVEIKSEQTKSTSNTQEFNTTLLVTASGFCSNNLQINSQDMKRLEAL